MVTKKYIGFWHHFKTKIMKIIKKITERRYRNKAFFCDINKHI